MAGVHLPHGVGVRGLAQLERLLVARHLGPADPGPAEGLAERGALDPAGFGQALELQQANDLQHGTLGVLLAQRDGAEHERLGQDAADAAVGTLLGQEAGEAAVLVAGGPAR